MIETEVFQKIRSDSPTLGDLNGSPASAVPSDLIVPGYEVHSELARGGMGVVYSAQDHVLQREVAIKTLLPGPVRPLGAMRFVAESRITARLPHPGVPPVYALGTLVDGRPFLAMKLIRGQTLMAHLAARPDPSHDLPRWLRVFEQVVQTVAFAHTQGIVHRDLKPANIMVGAFGEVQVMDWGLAKELRTTSAETPIETNSSEPLSPDLTLDGSVLGTPSYMPPEQARGEVHLIDRQSDVFSLGGVLLEILTGVPPYSAHSSISVLAKAVGGEIQPSLERLASSRVDDELIALTTHCLRVEIANRPVDAQAVALAMAAYHAGVEERLRRAETERAAAEARTAEERKRRLVQIAFGGALLVIAALVGFGARWQAVQRADQAQREGEQNTALAQQEAEALQKEAARDHERAEERERLRGTATVAIAQARDLQDRSLWIESQRVLERARAGLVEAALPESIAAIDRAMIDLDFLRTLDEVRLTVGRNAEAPPASGEPHPMDREYERAFQKYSYAILSDDPAPVVERLKASPIRTGLLASLDDWLVHTANPAYRIKLWTITTAIGSESWRVKLATYWLTPGRVQRLRDETLPEERTPALYFFIAQELQLHNKDSRSILREGCQRFPGDFWLHYELATNLLRYSPVLQQEALGTYRVALAQRPQDGIVWFFLGMTNRFNNNADSVECFQNAVKFAPHYAEGYVYLGLALVEIQDFVAARKVFETAFELFPNSPLLHKGFAAYLFAMKQSPDALNALRKVAKLQPEVFDTHLELGILLQQAGNIRGALHAYRNAMGTTTGTAGGYILLSSKFEALGELTDAKNAAWKSIEQSSFYGFNYRPVIRLAEETHDEAMLDAIVAKLSLQSKNQNALNELAQLHADRGHFEKATQTLRAYLQLFKNSTTAYERSRIQAANADLTAYENFAVWDRDLPKALAQQDVKFTRADYCLAFTSHLVENRKQPQEAMKLLGSHLVKNPVWALASTSKGDFWAVAVPWAIRAMKDPAATEQDREVTREFALRCLENLILKNIGIGSGTSVNSRTQLAARRVHSALNDKRYAYLHSPEFLNSVHASERPAWEKLWID